MTTTAILDARPKAVRFIRSHFGRRSKLLDMGEMVSIGIAKLTEVAITRWRPNRGDLWTYAEQDVRSSVQKAVSREFRQVKIRSSTSERMEYRPDMEEAVDLNRAIQGKVAPVRDYHDPGCGWSVEQVATAAGVTPRTVRRMISKGTLYARRSAQGYRIPDGIAMGFVESRAAG